MKKSFVLILLVLVSMAGTFHPASRGLCADGLAESQLIKESGKGKLYNLDDTRLLVLSGTFFEMGQQYGALLGKDISRLYDTAINSAFIKTGLFSQDELDSFARNTFKTLPMRQKELIRGIALASGLSQEKVILTSDLIMVQILARKKYGGNITSCTSAAVWGKYTVDGKTLTARNFDFPNLFRTVLKDYSTVIVFNPSDGSNSVAGVGLTGSIYFMDAMSSKGLYVEVNNAADSAGLVMFSNRTQAAAQVMNILFDADDSQEFYNMVNSARFGYSFILMVADKTKASYCEISCWDSKKREAVSDTAIAAANQFNDPSWGVLSLPSPAVWYSSYREDTLLKMAKSGSATGADAKYFKSVLNVPFYNDDGSVGKGVSVLKKNPADDEVTVWQVITQPADLKVWLRFPTISDWMAIDLKKYFAK